MATFLFDTIIFGPVKSRRLGVSLGINLLPADSKWCSFNCIYCECGWTVPGPYEAKGYPSGQMVREGLEIRLRQMQQENKEPDTITFAGNGEPTLHPEFGAIISDTLILRDRYAPGASIAVLSNGTMLGNSSVFKALEKVEQNILKIDSAIEETMRLLNQPEDNFSFGQLISNIGRFKGRFILQTLFVQGTFKGQVVDNTTDKELEEWARLVGELKPRQVMIYTIARDTPSAGLRKVSVGKLQEIAAMIEQRGIRVQVSG